MYSMSLSRGASLLGGTVSTTFVQKQRGKQKSVEVYHYTMLKALTVSKINANKLWSTTAEELGVPIFLRTIEKLQTLAWTDFFFNFRVCE